MGDNSEYSLQTICEGNFVEDGCSVRTIVFRVNGAAMDDWINSEKEAVRTGLTDYDEYRAYCRKCSEVRQAWDEEIRYLLGWHEPSGTITHNAADIFTAVFME